MDITILIVINAEQVDLFITEITYGIITHLGMPLLLNAICQLKIARCSVIAYENVTFLKCYIRFTFICWLNRRT